jgi:hypothetical protein
MKFIIMQFSSRSVFHFTFFNHEAATAAAVAVVVMVMQSKV